MNLPKGISDRSASPHPRRRQFSSRFLLRLLIVAFAMQTVTCCGPGRSGGRQRTQKKLKPLVFKQHVPNVPEKTLTASGPKEGRIGRSDPRFRDLVPNYNPDIIFKDEEGTGEDRLMTQRCKERLNTLAVSVMNLWPGVRLRVTESWDSEGLHHADSLHYEGRAVDITTSDRDSSKYGMLARLAVEAGFDWVYYESRAHVHCSVKSESKHAAKSMGCFTANTTVQLASGLTLPMWRLQIGDRVRSLNAEGNLEYSEVLLFLHRNPSLRSRFLRLSLASGHNLTITPSHLILRWEKPNTTALHHAIPVYAQDVRIHDQLLLSSPTSSELTVDSITRIEEVFETGVYAPLTVSGTIVVNDIVASCYAVIYSQRLAHLSFAPFRWYNSLELSFKQLYQVTTEPFVKSVSRNSTLARRYLPRNGVHWYCRFLERVTSFFVPDSWMLEQ